ncbi:glucan endo-1,3-beta-glucosidase 8-like [Zingiber officinale]|uniref:glucan endo-1,3-beta-D-glucosidase n=1 Tax=Zingiber officinale TaxID=94328 RepID=A0A8J5FZU8_ZINOF|nr:glucan endo-1,3-beta-glucosidase 8-like [Zingiber officinale]KAG6498935.1 hypothetical protein ZIOFF_038688 [Zingiber officinale]
MGASRFLQLFLLLGLCACVVQGLGVNWGTMATHPLPPKTVVQLLKDNNITRVKLFDANSDSMSALAGTNIEVMVAIPNNMLKTMNDYGAARDWVKRSVTRYNFEGGVNIKYVAVGNEPFLESYNGSFLNVTFPAFKNIQNALNDAGVGDTIKATIPLNADVYNSPASNPVPSAGRFRTDINDLMIEIVTFMNQTGAPFTVNIYPFLSLYLNADFPVNYAFFDGGSDPVNDNGILYTNVFDANFDTLVSALGRVGLGNLPIIIGEVGWPTDGDRNANAAYAERFYNGLLPRLAANRGTPLRPSQYIEVYLFSLIDEDYKSIQPGNFERHWGILKYDGQPKFNIDLTGQGRSITLVPASGVSYLPRKWCVFDPNGGGNISTLGDQITFACTYSDCTSLGYGSSCNGLDTNGNASYAFNMYYQVQNHQDMSCDFQGIATETTQDPSTSSPACNFTIQIEPYYYSTASSTPIVPLLAVFIQALLALVLM